MEIIVFYLEIPSELIGIMENVGKRNILIACELRNTGKRPSLMTCELGNTGTGTSLMTCELRNTGTQTSFNLYFGCLNLHFECLNLYFKCLNLYFGYPGGRARGRRRRRRRRPNNSPHLVRPLDHHVQGANIPFGNPSLRLTENPRIRDVYPSSAPALS